MKRALPLGFVGILVLAAVSACVSACGSAGTTTTPAAGDTPQSGPLPPVATPDMPAPTPDKADASAPPTPPASTPSETYPAFKPDIGQLVNRGGAILAAPRIVTVTWVGDPSAPLLEDFADKLGASSYWAQGVGEYGVGPSTSDASLHVHIPTAPPATISDDAIETYIVDQLKNPAANNWPVPDASTVYVVYLPEATHLTSGGQDACQDFDGYHTEVKVGSNAHVLYAIILETCHDMQAVGEFTTQLASHEIAEASTDPHTNTDNGVVGFDDDHLSWELFQDNQDEDGDACEYYSNAYYVGGGAFPFGLQRLWSNAQAAAGHDPCVPAAPEAFFNVTQLDAQAITVNLGGKNAKPQKTKGVEIPVGQTKSFQIGYYSDAPIDSWTLEAIEGDGGDTPPSPSLLSFSIDKASGKNGDTANVSVTVKAAPAKGNAILMTLKSKRDGLQSHYMPVLIGAY